MGGAMYACQFWEQAMEELVGARMEGAQSVDLLVEPALQPAEIPRRDLGFELRAPQLLHGLLPELARVHRPQGVAREIAEGPVGPVHVLEHAHFVRRRLDAGYSAYLAFQTRGRSR